MAQHIYATGCGRCGCVRPIIRTLLPALTHHLASSSLLRRRKAPMGASDHLGLAAVAAAKPRNGRTCMAVLGEPLPALDDPGILVHPSADFAAQALVSSTQQVIVSIVLLPRAAFRFYLSTFVRKWVARVRRPAPLRRRMCGWS